MPPRYGCGDIEGAERKMRARPKHTLWGCGIRHALLGLQGTGMIGTVPSGSRQNELRCRELALQGWDEAGEAKSHVTPI